MFFQQSCNSTILANGMQLLNTMMLPGLNINPMTNTISSFDGGKVILQNQWSKYDIRRDSDCKPRQIRRIEYWIMQE